MGLDQYAHLRGVEYDFDKYRNDESCTDNNQFYWRKHARLQQFMSAMYAKQNPKESNDNDMGLGFNGGPVVINEEVVKHLEEAINNGYYDYFATDGFFWGQQFQEESVREYKEQDIEFLQWCEDQLSNGNIPEYYCSW